MCSIFLLSQRELPPARSNPNCKCMGFTYILDSHSKLRELRGYYHVCDLHTFRINELCCRAVYTWYWIDTILLFLYPIYFLYYDLEQLIKRAILLCFCLLFSFLQLPFANNKYLNTHIYIDIYQHHLKHSEWLETAPMLQLTRRDGYYYAVEQRLQV